VLDLDPRFTEVIYLDTETIVPVADRRRPGRSLKFDPFRPGHEFLGGVFDRTFPLGSAMPERHEFWSWREKGERATLEKVLNFFRDSWARIEARGDAHPDLVLVGHGLARFDLPMLVARSMELGLARPGELFDLFFKTKTVDLSNAGLALRRRKPVPILYPISARELGALLGGDPDKPSGKKVWELYDRRRYDDIEQRVRGEVDEIERMAARILGISNAP
jgi:hypothetical protein